MQENSENAVATDALAQRLANVEELLRQQRDLSRKNLRMRWVSAILMLALVAVVAWGLFCAVDVLKNATEVLETATKDVPAMVVSATETLEELQTTLTDINSLDFEALNETIIGIKDSVAELQKVVENLGKLFKPFG